MQRSNLPADDIVAITQTVHLYGHVLDGRLWSWLPEVFTPDGVFDMSHEPGTEVGGVRLEGIPAIAEAFGRIQHALAHHVSNVFIFQDGEQTRSLCKFFMPDAKGRLHTGEYADLFVRTEAGWRIKHRVVKERKYWDVDATPWTFLTTPVSVT